MGSTTRPKSPPTNLVQKTHDQDRGHDQYKQELSVGSWTPAISLRGVLNLLPDENPKLRKRDLERHETLCRTQKKSHT